MPPSAAAERAWGVAARPPAAASGSSSVAGAAVQQPAVGSPPAAAPPGPDHILFDIMDCCVADPFYTHMAAFFELTHEEVSGVGGGLVKSNSLAPRRHAPGVGKGGWPPGEVVHQPNGDGFLERLRGH